MDVVGRLSTGAESIKTVEMQTCGEPTRIVVAAYPTLSGSTLLEKRAHAQREHDYIRRRLMAEPRGHPEMYGAILIRETEMTASGLADIGVLFCHNEGYSTMCGHATIALGRFLVDTQDLEVFPRREQLEYHEQLGTTRVRLHAPCGLVEVAVPTANGGRTSDPSRPVSFLNVPSFTAALDITVDIPETKRWDQLRKAGRETVRVDIAYGGAFYAIVTAEQLGFRGGLAQHQVRDLDDASAALKAALQQRSELFRHATERDLEFLYGVMITDIAPGYPPDKYTRHETGLCFFADQQIDRSPTGSCVSARVALAVAKGAMTVGESCMYHSMVSLGHGASGFGGKAVEVLKDGSVIVEVTGSAFYTGTSVFKAEEGDALKDGFTFVLY